MIDNSKININNILEINTTDGTILSVIEHTVTPAETDAGGFDLNLTLISSAAPTVESLSISPDDNFGETGIQIDPIPNGDKTVDITAVVSDDNGWNDIDTVVAVITGPSTVSDSPITLSFVSITNSILFSFI